ncbi:MAG: malate dehydrogenase [Candidatus Solincola sediminis]|uniref:L-lactate dehydrogenase n=1 Tax=Candidatus Solincola sediminis TaxID=1797199 RepID=A0A1F2WQ04_9ACTN|nr:MAG: malate dehydrogenase [Candidatus Solincola sediminis]OFW58962.1 MAG: malate dehydrogenase [Candidatus Solincola sediminis]
MPKVAVIGAGQVGSTAAMRLAESGIAEIALIDVKGDLARAKALDISQALPLTSSPCKVTGGSDYELAGESEVVVITAGMARQPGMSRHDLLRSNAKIVRDVVTSIKDATPDCAIIMVTNPLDEMSYLAWRLTGWKRHRIMGMAGLLDSCRFASFIADKLEIPPDQVDAIVLGSHGDTMLPLPRLSTVSGTPVTDRLSPEILRELEERTRNAGAEIVSLLQTGSAYYAPSACIARMAQAIMGDEELQVPASVLLDGEYGMRDVFLGVPVTLARGGWKIVVELPLLADEQEGLETCANLIRKRLVELDEWLEGAR